MEKLIEDLLQFSLAVRGELSLKLEIADFCGLMARIEEVYPARAAAKGIELVVEYPDEPLMVHIDREKVDWVLDQLMDNALKFTPEGGSIWVAAQMSDGVMNVSIVDTGIGIPQERLEEIFQLFHQLDGSNTRRYQGTGLGLAFVHRILDAHGSQIQVDSNVGRGTRFEFALPVLSD